MKTKITSMLIASVILLSSLGCGAISNEVVVTAQDIQKSLQAVLPPDFVGDFTFQHTNPYFHLGIKVLGIHKTADGTQWSWTGVEYDRGDLFNTSGQIRLTTTGK